MPIFDRFDVVSIPFPYADRPIRQRRPALIVSSTSYERQTGLIWVVMITAAENRHWPGDVVLSEPRGAGLSIPSIVRPTKIATIEAAQASRIGSISADEGNAVQAEISRIAS
jgi:mRNA interferase MazF